MDFTLTDEHRELKDTVRRFLDDKSGEQAVRSTMETERGYDPEVLAGDLRRTSIDKIRATQPRWQEEADRWARR